MPASYPLHLALTEEQMTWLSAEASRTNKSKSRLVQEMLEAHRSGLSVLELNRSLTAKMEDMTAVQQAEALKVSTDLQTLLCYVKEIFRESAANLYRLNAVIDEFSDSEKVRDEVNEYVRKQESLMRSKTIQIQEACR